MKVCSFSPAACSPVSKEVTDRNPLVTREISRRWWLSALRKLFSRFFKSMSFSVYLHEVPSLIKFTALPRTCSHSIPVEHHHILSFTPGLLAASGEICIYLAFIPFWKNTTANVCQPSDQGVIFSHQPSPPRLTPMSTSPFPSPFSSRLHFSLLKSHVCFSGEVSCNLEFGWFSPDTVARQRGERRTVSVHNTPHI